MPPGDEGEPEELIPFVIDGTQVVSEEGYPLYVDSEFDLFRVDEEGDLVPYLHINTKE